MRLRRGRTLFTVAQTAEEFAAAIKRLATSRTNSAQVARRLQAARLTSYDARFSELVIVLSRHLEQRRKVRPALNILLLYDDGSTHVGTIYEHLDAFRKYSEHHVVYLPATGVFSDPEQEHVSFDFSIYDAIIVHYSVRLSLDEHIALPIANAIKAYRGSKLLFIQDEYDRTERARQWIEELGISAVFTNVPSDSLDFVYPRTRFAGVDFLPTLTGYAPEDPLLDQLAVPMAERTLLIAYRGRSLPHKYGALGYEKFRIGIDMRRICDERQIAADINVTEESRIYGADWYRFIGSARATLGTESGSNVFDFDGELARLSREYADLPFSDFAEKYLGPHEGLVRMNQVSPKIFEAIRLRTALVLFEGDYSGVVRPGEHFIPLKKDYSNVSEVLAKLQDLPALEAMTERAYRDVIESGRYSYRTFIEGIDAYLNKAAGGRKRATIVSVPMFAVYDSADAVPVWTGTAQDALFSNTILDPKLTRAQVIALANGLISRQQQGRSTSLLPSAAETIPSAEFTAARMLWRILPPPVRFAAVRNIKAVAQGASDKDGVVTKFLRRGWRLIPKAVRHRIASRLR